ncbi:TetR family transcriptional regulator [Mycobacterium sp. djl-10]|nr:TetR family transcriptional regulator [Mycobacterium sp. djl-10]
MSAHVDGNSPGPRYGHGRDALLAAAVRVVASDGLRKLTYRAVAREAGVTYGLVHHHFGSRDALIEAALEYSVRTSIVAITTSPGSGDIDALFADLSEIVAADPATQAFQYELILEAQRRPELMPIVDRLYASYRTALAAEFSLAGLPNDDAVVRLIFAALDGLVFQQTAMGGAEHTRDALARLRDILHLLSDRLTG